MLKTSHFPCKLDGRIVMGLKVILLIVLSMVVCSFCGHDFQSVNRHAWRCQVRMEEVNPEKGDEKEEPNNLAGEL